MKRKNSLTVVKSIEEIGGQFVGFGRNAHGPTVIYKMLGFTWEYGFDSTPKAEYDIPKTIKGILHSMVAKSKGRGIDAEKIYEAVKCRSSSKTGATKESGRNR